jgi:putative transposase
LCCGIDWGVKDVAVASDERFDLPCRNHLRTKQKKLKVVQQKMARRKRPKNQPLSAGYQAARVQFAKLHAQVARQRKHDARQWARNVVTENKLIAVEDFKPMFLAKTGMARKASDNSVGMVKAKLIRYGRQAGRTVVLVPAAYTTQTCSDCGSKTKTTLTLQDRIFVCTVCGLIADRDRNAAKRVLVQAEMNLRSVEDVRHDGTCSEMLSELQSPRL